MAEGIATRSSRGHRTICVPIEEEDYLRIIHDPKAFRRTLDDCFRQTPGFFRFKVRGLGFLSVLS